MAMKTDGIRIGHSHVHELLNAGHKTLCRRISGTADIEPDIREENRIPMARIERKTGPMIDHDLVEFMKPLGEKSIKIDDHRVSLSRLIIPRFDEHTL
jgi:hypothetical protein